MFFFIYAIYLVFSKYKVFEILIFPCYYGISWTAVIHGPNINIKEIKTTENYLSDHKAITFKIEINQPDKSTYSKTCSLSPTLLDYKISFF